MKRVVFYSWQSDLDLSATRSLIEEALTTAARSIAADASVSIEPVVDRDTVGVAGTPAVVDTLLGKIATADVFVADVSIINAGAEQRPTPNPNVLVELGFAVARLGWEHILLVQNTAYGKPEALPFDLRHRRIVRYELKPEATDRDEVKDELGSGFEAALRQIFDDMATGFEKRREDEPMWWGRWETPQEFAGQSWFGHLFIHEVGAVGFLFQLQVTSGSHIGIIAGRARFLSPDVAYAAVPVPASPGKHCDLLFRRRYTNQRREILIEDGGDCTSFHGAGVGFGGYRLVREREILFEMGVLDEMDLERLYGIAGERYFDLIKPFQGLTPTDNKDPFVATVTAGGIRGLYTISEGIVMRGPEGQLWAAYIDGDDVRYFTTEPEHKQKLPLTIEEWRQRFKEKAIVFDSPVRTIPQLP